MPLRNLVALERKGGVQSKSVVRFTEFSIDDPDKIGAASNSMQLMPESSRPSPCSMALHQSQLGGML
jgi:hypothetical protein